MSKIKIRILRATHMGADGVAVPGDEVEVSQELAQQLVGNGRAEHVKGPIYEYPEETEEVEEAAEVETAEAPQAETAEAPHARRRQP